MTDQGDDIFRDDIPTIVDCDVLEGAKENVQPFGTGRRVTALSAILSTPHAQRDAKLAEIRQRLRADVSTALNNPVADPLDAYCKLVNWTVENYPQGHSAESGLLELLEEATRVLKDDREGLWRGEKRYLRLWLLYASYVERPVMVYRFLIANDIGTDFALLYEELAAVLERDGRRKEADEAYALGIARRATPTDHLQSRYSDFQKRMMSSTLLSTPGPVSSVPTRRVLASTTSAASATTALAQGSNSQTSTSNSRLQIFVDPSGEESERAISTENAWNDIGTRKTRIKENVPEVKKMGGTTLKQAGRTKRLASGSGAGSKISVYRDEGTRAISAGSEAKSFALFTESKEGEVENMIPSTPRFMPFRDETSTLSPTRTGLPAVPGSVMRVKASLRTPAITTEAEALRKNPLKNYDVEH